MRFFRLRSNRATYFVAREQDRLAGALGVMRDDLESGDLEQALDKYQERETEKLMAKGKENQAEIIADRCECIRHLIRHLPESNRTIAGLEAMIRDLFAERTNGEILTLSSVHKSKGLEWGRVFLLNRAELMPSKWARQAWQQVQERNLIYVAVTRAQRSLVDIELEGYTIYR